MAKDGTSRGGARVGAGRKPKALQEKLLEGNLGHRDITKIDIPDIAPDGEKNRREPTSPARTNISRRSSVTENPSAPRRPTPKPTGGLPASAAISW